MIATRSLIPRACGSPIRCLPTVAMLLLALGLMPTLIRADEPDADPPAREDAEAAAAAQAAEEDAAVSAIDALVADLADADYDVREIATQKLMDHETLSDDRLADALAAAEVPEQAHRLRKIAMHRYYKQVNPVDAPLDRGRGGLGVDLSERNIERVLHPDQFPELDNPAILLTETVPGFPAFVHLQAGDMVFGLDGEHFTQDLTVNRLRDRLADYTAGEEMTLHIVRNGEPMDITVTLDNVARIDSVHRVYSSLRAPGLYQPFVEHLNELSPGDRFTTIHIGTPD